MWKFSDWGNENRKFGGNGLKIDYGNEVLCKQENELGNLFSLGR